MPETPAAVLAAAQARHAATRGPWYRAYGRIYGAEQRGVCQLIHPAEFQREADATFILEAHNTDVPALVTLGTQMLGLLTDVETLLTDAPAGYYRPGLTPDQAQYNHDWQVHRLDYLETLRAFLEGRQL